MSDAEQSQAERLIIENRNDDGSYDMKGIANDIADLLRSQPTRPVDERLEDTFRGILVMNGLWKTDYDGEKAVQALVNTCATHLQAAVQDTEERIRKEYEDR